MMIAIVDAPTMPCIQPGKLEKSGGCSKNTWLKRIEPLMSDMTIRRKIDQGKEGFKTMRYYRTDGGGRNRFWLLSELSCL